MPWTPVTSCTKKRLYRKSQTVTAMLAVTPDTQEAEGGGLQVQGLIRLQSKFKVILGHLVLSEDPASNN